MQSDKIIIRGARQHNLKNIQVEIPRNKLVVITGLSGSGKSTLAFDTLYAEGQRRYVESLSTYARQFLERMEKPDVDLIEGLSPAIAIQQKAASHNPRSTVGTVTEIYDYLRLLFARTGTPHCYQCGQPITSQSLDQIVDKVMSLSEGSKILILAPVVTGQKGSHEKHFQQLKKEGFARVRVDGNVLEIEDVGKLDKNKKHTIEVVVDRLIVKESINNRLADSLELAMSLSDGLVTVDVSGREPVLFSEKSACIACGISYPDFTPASFSFNSPQGACPQCDGLGSTTEFDPDLIIPNQELSLREGAVAPWANRNTVHFIEFLDALTGHYGVDIYTLYKDLPDHFKKVLSYGSGDERITFYVERGNRRYTYKKHFEGLIPNLQRRYLETESYQSREEIKRYMNFQPCPECAGTKLNKASRSVKVGGLTICETTALSVSKARSFFNKLNLGGKKAIIAERILKEINERLGFLENVGLSYLTLDRSAATLSGGESQRIRLATQIGSKLTGVLYVLDEPSIGLHQRDNRRLLDALREMRDLGNTVLVVEHDEETIRSSDHVIDMGPGAGVQGGQVVFSGTPEALLEQDQSLTGNYLSGKKRIEIPLNRRRGQGKKLIIEGATENNLKKIDVEFPLGCFICVTGVSGSGKSTLVLETLNNLLAQRLYHARIPAGSHTRILGLEHVDKVIHIDQSPIGRTPRSNPGTYTGVFTFIRELFSRTAEARIRGYKPGRFSFNVKGGRCEACKGDGIIRIEMHFLPDVYVACDVCRGKRFNRETLEIKYKGKNIADVLDMTVNQSLDFFAKIHNIRQKLQTLVDVGLGYIQIGQPAPTLSGGEAQRVKLSRELSKKSTGRTVYILDEPTTGLHMDDIRKLLNVLTRFVAAENTVIVIEHNMDVIKTADHIIDLGPEGGDDGGRIVGCGSPEEIAAVKESYTGQFLKKVLYPI
ncbi:MAG: excinuclease ABC subunit UvrA [Pseudomonadota bacterium]|uniref:UvrABC system protein A n=1 Tax=Candidatus Desulfatibia profunda TaxID=2841695 RepID=A0A8J6TMB9_9BACT|nr:excinuclease ABC subunit UvrA [Candidatus Desulfatibia profunda]MBL7180215.1 excinuclease ABC subunit UvrA [Desulfobacterales bacterium]